MRAAHKALDAALTYPQWHQAASAVDRLTGAEAWRNDDACDHYHADLLREQRDQMTQLRTNGQAVELTDLLTHSLYRNLSDIQSPALYETALAGTKRLVTTYLDECELALDWLADSEAFPVADKRARFEQAAHVFGRSALMLSGGATLGFYHLGVVKGLFEQGLLPDVISGSSTGAMIAAGVCSKNDDELARMYAEPDTIRRDGLLRVGLKEWAKSGSMMSSEQLHDVIRHNAGDATFHDAHAHSGRVLCISVSPTRVRQKPRLLTHLTAPDVMIASAALASSALPGLFPPVVLEMRDNHGAVVPYIETEKWVDGSIFGDLPKLRLSRLHNINHFIVSQTNPHVLPIAQLQGGNSGALPTLTGLAGSLARNQGSGVVDLVRRVSGSGTLGLATEQLHTLVNQDYKGDIDIHPRFNPQVYSKVLSNPTRDDLDFFILEGQRAVWPRLAMIRDHTRISRAFERSLKKINDR
jgi:TAG lipase / steryl ester hydrolase / phospholipase A2 / LPA acyltransferase